ncbi:MAG: hypothetical protein JXR56_06545 [Candidatus Cloacimonetes bacterium]|nr:hypothetical protein [Candidatus Cloacimonadota bacterium]
MNIAKLKEAEQKFMEKYPGGFNNPEMMEIGKKHKMEQRVEFCQTNFALDRFDNPAVIVDSMVKIVSNSSMVSLFEKPKFRDFANNCSPGEKVELALALKELLHGDEKAGFNLMSDILKREKLAKWTLLTIIPTYFKPTYDVFIKPTTVKGIISFLEIEDIKYSSSPSYEFYTKYRDYINEIKMLVDDSFRSSNAAFSGFLMMSI